MESKGKTFTQYIIFSCLIGYGLINGVINFLIALVRKSGQMYSVQNAVVDMMVFVPLLTLILACCVYPLTRSAIKKRQCPKPVYRREEHAVIRFIPENNLIATVVIILLACVVCIPLCVGFYAVIMYFTGDLSFWVYTPLKVVVCGVTGGFVGYLAIIHTATKREQVFPECVDAAVGVQACDTKVSAPL